MRRSLLMMGAAVGVVLAAAAAATAVTAASPAPYGGRHDRDREVRFATFNASLNRRAEGQLAAELASGAVTPQTQAVLDIIELTDPDVLLVNEFDTGTDGDSDTVARFAELAGYPYWFTAPSNTGVQSGFDLDRTGSIGGAGDAFGFGDFPGQYGLVVLSKYPIETQEVRTFQTFRWVDMSGALLPVDDAGESWYTPAELAVLRLSSKSHWDVPIDIGRGRDVHFLVSHPTPPVFDGPEDRNGRRNFDEIRFWADYITPGRTSRYIYDDSGRRGGLGIGQSFVIAGDQNSDPLDGDSVPGAIQQLLDHRRVNTSFTPRSDGAVEAAAQQGGANLAHEGDPQYDTADFADTAPGNLRVDYVLPSRDLRIVGGGVFWPLQGEDGSELTGVFPFPSSDHRLVYVDVRRR